MGNKNKHVMDTGKALKLIKTGIQGLLDGIAHGRDTWIRPKDLAEGYQIDEEEVFEWLQQNKDLKLSLLVGQDEALMRKFDDLTIQLLNSEWYQEYYQSKVDEVRIGLRYETDWENTKKSLMPTFKPNK